MKPLILIAALMLAGCVQEDDGQFAVSWEYMELEQAYERCIGRLSEERDEKNFEKRLACTQAVYGGGH